MDTAARRPLRPIARRAVVDDRPAPGASGGEPLTGGERRAWFLSRWAPGLDRAVAIARATGPDDVRARLAALLSDHPELRTRYAQTDRGPFRLPAADGPAPLVVSAATSVDELTREALRAPLDPQRGRLVVAILAGDLLALTVHRLAADPAAAEALVDHLAAGVPPALPFEVPPAPAGETPAASPRAPAGEAPAGPAEGAAASPEVRAARPDAPAASPQVPAAEASAGEVPAGPAEGVAAEAVAAALGARIGRDEPPVTLPGDARPDSRSWASATVARTLPADLELELDRLIAALAAVLARYTGRTDIVLGSMLPVPGERLANPVVLPLDAGGDPTAAALLDRARAALERADRARTVPFDRVVAALRPQRDPAAHPLFRVTAEVRDRAAAAVLPPAGAALTDLAVRVVRRPGSTELVAEYATELFPADGVERLLDHLVELARDAAAHPDRRLGDLALLTPAERDRAVPAHDPAAAYRPAGRCLHELVREWAERTPDADACRYLGRALTYRELAERADRLSERLQELGTGPEDVVAVVVDRGFDLPVSALGVLGAGAAYLPLDPGHPPERLAGQVADAGCPAVVADERYADRLPTGLTVLRPDGRVLAAGPARTAAARLGRRPTPDNLAYVMFTSGSSGRPKGVMVAHRSVVNLVRHYRDRYGLGPGDRLLQFAGPAFDASVFDLFCTLGNGATLVDAPRATLLDPRALTGLMAAERVTVLGQLPAVVRLLDPAELTELRVLGVGGERVPGRLVQQWRTERRAVFNVYGPTEATVLCTDYACPLDGSADDPPIGGPIAHTTAYVLDRYGAPAPAGVPGELVIGGAGVTRGYVGRPGLTASRFSPDPFGPPGSRLYRTGDLVRRRADGLLEFVGRVDRQVKLRGQRVEPDEVESALRPHPDVDAAAVLVSAGNLVAYLAPPPGRTAPDLAAVRAFLRDRLPGYLIPSAVVALVALPLTSNGKVDLRALAATRPPAPRTGPAPAPGPAEVAVSTLWSRLLRVDRPGPEDDFFASGGDSLGAVELARQVEAAVGVPVTLAAFWAEPTLGALTRTVRAGRSALPR